MIGFRRMAATLVAVLAVGSSVAGCGSDTAGSSDNTGDGGSAGNSDSLMDDLSGRVFTTGDITDPTVKIVPGSTIRLTFEDGRVAANAGCNSMSGAASVKDGKLIVEPMASTEMGCDQALMDQDVWLSAFLSSSPTIALSGSDLTLTNDDSSLELNEFVEAVAPLEGTTWKLDSILSGSGPDGAVSTAPIGAKGSIEISDGSMAVDTGCNKGRASVTFTDSELTAEPLALTKMACSPDLNELEGTFLTVLTAPTAYVIDGQRLTLTSADGEDGLGFVAAQE